MDCRMEHDIHPEDFNLEQEVALYSLQQQVRNRTIKPSGADQLMRMLDGYYYDNFSEESDTGRLSIDGIEA